MSPHTVWRMWGVRCGGDTIMPAPASVQKEALHKCETVLALPGSKDITKLLAQGLPRCGIL